MRLTQASECLLRRSKTRYQEKTMDFQLFCEWFNASKDDFALERTMKFCCSGTQLYMVGMGLTALMILMGMDWILFSMSLASARRMNCECDGGSSEQTQVGTTFFGPCGEKPAAGQFWRSCSGSSGGILDYGTKRPRFESIHNIS